MKITVVSVPYIILKITAQLYSKTASPDKGGKVKNKHLAFDGQLSAIFFFTQLIEEEWCTIAIRARQRGPTR